MDVTVELWFDGYMEKNDFILLADEPILDFVNTLIHHEKHQTESLSSPDAARSFFETVFGSRPVFDAKSLRQLIRIREQMSVFFLRHLKYSKQSERSSKLFALFDSSKFKYTIEVSRKLGHEKFSLIIQPTIKSESLKFVIQKFFDFLMSANPERIKKCKSKTCSHLFYDRTKSNSRVWCMMNSCGNLAKVRKFRKKIE